MLQKNAQQAVLTDFYRANAGQHWPDMGPTINICSVWETGKGGTSSAGIWYWLDTGLMPPSFDQMEGYLRQDWMFRKRREIQTDKIAEMRERYRVVFAEGQ